MAILFGRSIGAIPVSIVTQEDHTSTIEITENPIEFGADVTDHAYVQPKTVTIKGMVGNNQGGFVGQSTAAAAWQALKRYQETRLPFFLITGLDVYKDMLIQKLSVNRNKENAAVLDFTAELKQIIIVGSGFTQTALNAPAGGIAVSLLSTTISAGVSRQRASPTIRRGDNVVVDVSVDTSTLSGRKNANALVRVGL